MSIKDALGVAFANAGIDYSGLVVDKNSDYKGRAAIHVGFTMNGEFGPIMYDTWVTDDLKLDNEFEANLIANNAVKNYANHYKETK